MITITSAAALNFSSHLISCMFLLQIYTLQFTIIPRSLKVTFCGKYMLLASGLPAFRFLQQANLNAVILLADHTKAHDLILIYRVENINKTSKILKSRGWKEEKVLEIPQGPCYVFRDPSDNAIAIYENQRPGVMEKFRGRID
jgi:hypothetical protein